jgi:hypothetical protein
MTGTDCGLFTYKSSWSYLNHLVQRNEVLTVTARCKQITVIFKRLYNIDKSTGNVFHVHGKKVCTRRRCIATLILNDGSTWR